MAVRAAVPIAHKAVIMRHKAIVIKAIVAVRLEATITLKTNRERKAVISIGATVAVLNIVRKVAKIVKVAKVCAILQMPVIDTEQLPRADNKVLGTPKAVLIVIENNVLVPARTTNAHADRSNKG